VRYYIASLKANRSRDIVLWWSPDGKGYTRNLSRAGTYSEEEAKKIAIRGSECVAVPSPLAWQMTVPHVSRETLDQYKVTDTALRTVSER